MILLYFRTLIVALIFLVLPFVVSSIITFFTVAAVQLSLLIIFGVLSVILFIFIVHLNSTLEIFIEATWYEAYGLCKKEDAEYGGPKDDHGHDAHGHGEHHDDHGGHDAHHDTHGHH